MATFIGADRDTDLITWAAQVDTNSLEDLLDFWLRLCTGWEMDIQKQFLPTETSENQTLTEERLEELTALCRGIQDALTSVWEHQGIRRGFLTYLNAMRGPTTPTRRFVVPAGADPDTLIGLQECGYSDGYRTGSPLGILAWHISQFIERLMDGSATLGRCVECGSLFPVYNPRQRRFCSNRCRNRAGVKKFRAKTTA